MHSETRQQLRLWIESKLVELGVAKQSLVILRNLFVVFCFGLVITFAMMVYGAAKATRVTASVVQPIVHPAPNMMMLPTATTEPNEGVDPTELCNLPAQPDQVVVNGQAVSCDQYRYAIPVPPPVYVSVTVEGGERPLSTDEVLEIVLAQCTQPTGMIWVKGRRYDCTNTLSSGRLSDVTDAYFWNELEKYIGLEAATVVRRGLPYAEWVQLGQPDAQQACSSYPWPAAIQTGPDGGSTFSCLNLLGLDMTVWVTQKIQNLGLVIQPVGGEFESFPPPPPQ